MKYLHSKIELSKDELLESNSEYMELQYYKIKENPYILKEKEAIYGIEIIKNEFINGETITETSNISKITKDEKRIDDVIEILKENKVTPCTLTDTINDYFKSIKVQD